jgi:DNA repair exonuclease SbcCD nuclease subunit
VRIAHLADLHFGKRALRMLDPATGLNQREIDLYDVSDHLADQLIDLAPDVVVIAGDLYNAAYPTPLAIQRCLRFLRRLRAAGLPVLIIGGNHDHKHTNQPSPLLLAEEFGDCVLFLQQGHWDFEGVRFHCLPFEAIADLVRDGGNELAPFDWAPCNMLVAHAYVDGANIASPPEDVKVPPAIIHDPHFSGVMLGHVHEHAQLDPGGNAYYPGALDRLTFKETLQTPTFYIHEIDPASADATTGLAPVMNTEEVVIEGVRPFLELVIDQQEMTLEELDVAVVALMGRALAGPDLDGVVVVLRIVNADGQLRASSYRTSWQNHLRQLGGLWLELDIETRTLRELMDQDFADVTGSENGTMQQRWRDFVRAQGGDDSMLELAMRLYETQANSRKVAVDE